MIKCVQALANDSGNRLRPSHAIKCRAFGRLALLLFSCSTFSVSFFPPFLSSCLCLHQYMAPMLTKLVKMLVLDETSAVK